MVLFNWGPEHQESFKLVKKEIATAPILAYYNPRKATVLQTDASIKGLGACLLQEESPVYFTSKALTEVTKRLHVTIKVESLAMAWAMEKFHHFLYANHFILETDQKPLETILSRSLKQATPHLQRILIRTFPYNFTVRYLPRLKNQLSDCYVHELAGLQDSIKLPKLSVYQITSQLNARSDSLQQLREATQADNTLAILKYTIQQGWPSSIKDLPSEIQPFWAFREELTIEDGLILKGTRIVYTKQEARYNIETHSLRDTWASPKCKLCAHEGNSVLARTR